MAGQAWARLPPDASIEFARDAAAHLTRRTISGNPFRSTAGNETVSFSFNYGEPYGEVVEVADAAGRRTRFDYDGLGRLKWTEVLDGSGRQMAGTYSYYNANGELVWSDGPRFDPEDYVWRDYDGAGRLIAEMTWHTRARPDGQGVELDDSDNRFPTTFNTYDSFGNLIKVTNPRGHYALMDYDALGRLTRERAFDGQRGVVVATTSYSYEPGGLVASVTSPLGAVTRSFYTSRGQIKRRENPDGSTNVWRYTLDGREAAQILPDGSTWEPTYHDARRQVTRRFRNVTGTVLATETRELDRRGNVLRGTDAEGHVFTNAYDGLDRVRVAAGPPGQPGVSAQQIATAIYDAAGVTERTRNALGEIVVTSYDALGRAVSREVRDAFNQLVRKSSVAYAPNHHSYVVTEGIASPITTETFTDNAGRAVLNRRFPGEGAVEFTRRRFDGTGNLIESTVEDADYFHDYTTYRYDALDRLVEQVRNPDDEFDPPFPGEVVSFAYDAAGNLTNRAMPGGLRWSGRYTADGRLVHEQLRGGSSAPERIFAYTYFTAGPHIGLLRQITDPRGLVHTNAYDAFRRLALRRVTGARPEHNVVTSFTYDRLGRVIGLSESTTGRPATAVTRAYDGYGQLVEEQVTLPGAVVSRFTQHWDAAGRRTRLASGDLSQWAFDFAHRADGALKSVAARGHTFQFAYGDHGLLESRASPWRVTTVTQRDGVGRPRQTITPLPGGAFTEDLAWGTDGRLLQYAAVRPGLTDAREFTYDYYQGNRLTTETIPPVNGRPAQLDYIFDGFYYEDGTVPSNLGVLSEMALHDGNFDFYHADWWAGGITALGRVREELSDVARRNVSGYASGAARVELAVDGRGQKNVHYDSTSTNGYWRARLELPSGPNGSSHSIVATAHHASGQWSPSAANTHFVNVLDRQTNTYDPAGNLTLRTLRQQNGTLVRTQALVWDGLGRLVSVVERDSSGDGADWNAVYDPLGRRLQTTYTIVVNHSPLPGQTLTIDSLFDPEVEFLEIAISVNGSRTWKVYGPDLSGSYGGMQGAGGLEATVREWDGAATGILNDQFGHSLATLTSGGPAWHNARLGAYGPLPGFPAPLLSPAVSLAEALVWRGLPLDPTGFYWIGARYYEPSTGRFLSADPLGHAASHSLYDFCGGDPINFFDPDGRDKNPLFQLQSLLSGLERMEQRIATMSQLMAVGYAQSYVNSLIFWNSAATSPQIMAARANDLAAAIDGIADSALAAGHRDAAHSVSLEIARSRADALAPMARIPGVRLSDYSTPFQNVMDEFGRVIGAESATIAFTGEDFDGRGGFTTGQRIGHGVLFGMMVAPAGRLAGRSQGIWAGGAANFLERSALAEVSLAQRVAAKTAPSTTRLGITRNNPADWRVTRDLWDSTGYGDILSDANRAAIARGRTPVVDSSWVRNFPEDAGLVGERIPMHHIQGTPITVPLPATRHLDAHMPGGFRYNPGGPGSALPVYPTPNP